jgi:23S rRNA m(5)U-1939 methyltransferase (EC 2.1.1.-)
MSIEYVHSCMIVDEDYRKILVATTEFFRNANLPHYRVLAHEGYLRHLVLRKGKNTGDIQVNIVTTTQFEFDMDTYANMLTKLTLNGEIKGILHTFNDSLSDAVIPEKINLLYGVTDFEDILLD